MSINLYPGQATMSPDLIKVLFEEAQRGMVARFASSVADIYFPSPTNNELLENGTGTFVEVGGVRLLLSNEHVVKHNKLHHSFNKSECFAPAAKLKYTEPWPIDVGASGVSDADWTQFGALASAVPLELFGSRYQTVSHEILWFAGYPGTRVKHLGDYTYSVCQALPTQEYLFLDDEVAHETFDPAYHFAVAYSPDRAQQFDTSGASKSPGLSDPHGLSGSLVWNTRRLECFYENQAWHSGLAVVAGIIWGWPKSNYLIATKVEHFRDFLMTASILPSSI